jgi:DNA-binding MarR family transcriptional regulator
VADIMSDFKDTNPYQITWLIRRLFRSMGQLADSYLEELGISAADRAVMEFLYPDIKLSVPQIAELYSVSRQHVQATVNSLIERKLLSVEENPKHKRSSLITLNDKGRSLFSEVAKKDKDAIKLLFNGVSDLETKRVRATLEKMRENLS